MVVQNQSELGEGLANPTDPHHTPTITQSSTQPQKIQKPRKPKRKDTQRLDSGNITIDSTPRQHLMNLVLWELLQVVVLGAKKPWGILLLELGLRVHLNIPMIHCSQENEIVSLKRRVKEAYKEKKFKELTKLRDYNKVGLTAMDKITLVVEEICVRDASKQGWRINDIDGQNENVVEEVVDAAQVITAAITTEENTLAQALEALKTSKPKDKGKGIMIEEPVKPIKKLEREKVIREKEANIALIEEWDDIQAKIDADHQLAERLQAQEQEELFDAEKATLFQQPLEKIRKHFAAKRAEEKRNKPPTQAQQRKIICTYLKNMEGYKLKDLKSKGFDSIQEMFDRAFKRVNTFEDFRTQLVEGKEKRTGEELIQESSKKQKVDNDKETAELKQCLEIIPDEEEVTIDVIPLVVKSPSIVGWKIHKEGIKSYYQIIRADGKSQMYMIFSHMLKSFSREDLEDLYKLVKAKYKSTRLVEDLDLLLWGDLKTMFEPHVEDTVWRNQQDYKVLD
ncbi:hypothetical protein Tco_1172104 [Tanacetum coccineum]